MFVAWRPVILTCAASLPVGGPGCGEVDGRRLHDADLGAAVVYFVRSSDD